MDITKIIDKYLERVDEGIISNIKKIVDPKMYKKDIIERIKRQLKMADEGKYIGSLDNAFNLLLNLKGEFTDHQISQMKSVFEESKRRIYEHWKNHIQNMINMKSLKRSINREISRLHNEGYINQELKSILETMLLKSKMRNPKESGMSI